jgi:hypothetical protein
VNQMYRIEITGLDKNSTEVVLYYNGTLNTHSVSWLGVVDPNFWLPHHTSSL